jgi:hypothetical protein
MAGPESPVTSFREPPDIPFPRLNLRAVGDEFELGVDNVSADNLRAIGAVREGSGTAEV